jgi:hypothetical protein
LQQSLASQKKNDQAAALADQVAAAWSRADVKPVASCYCHPDAIKLGAERPAR